MYVVLLCVVIYMYKVNNEAVFAYVVVVGRWFWWKETCRYKCVIHLYLYLYFVRS
jgi:hypothetical protein